MSILYDSGDIMLTLRGTAGFENAGANGITYLANIIKHTNAQYKCDNFKYEHTRARV